MQQQQAERPHTNYLQALILGLPDDEMRIGKPRYRAEAVEADTNCPSCGGTGQPGFANGKVTPGQCSCVRFHKDRSEAGEYKGHNNVVLKPKE